MFRNEAESALSIFVTGLMHLKINCSYIFATHFMKL